MKKYTIVTLGCRTNQYESQLFSERLQKMGFEDSKGNPADLCIVNTCSVTDVADATSRRQIKKLLREHPMARFVVTGCMAESAKIDDRIEILPNRDKEKIIEFLFPNESNYPELSIERFENHTRAFLKVQDGCNSFCSYCVIPYTRGRSRSRSLHEIVKEVQSLVSNGYREIVLTGINVGDYLSNEHRLADLVRAVDQIKGVERLRLSSIDPDEVDADLTDALLNGIHTCPSLHLVLQSGSNVILKRMNRKYTRQIFLDTVERLVSKNPDFTFTTDVIIGFPGETDSDFAETLEIINQVKFAKVHVFPFSVRSRTRAALLPNRISTGLMQKRKDEILQKAEKAAYERRENFLHRTMDVLLEEGSGEFLSGHTNNFLLVQVPRGSYLPNELVQVEMVKNSPTGLIGRIV